MEQLLPDTFDPDHRLLSNALQLYIDNRGFDMLLNRLLMIFKIDKFFVMKCHTKNDVIFLFLEDIIWNNKIHMVARIFLAVAADEVRVLGHPIINSIISDCTLMDQIQAHKKLCETVDRKFTIDRFMDMVEMQPDAEEFLSDLRIKLLNDLLKFN